MNKYQGLITCNRLTPLQVQENFEIVKQQSVPVLGNHGAEDQVVVEKLHQDITRLTQRYERLYSEHVDAVVVLRVQYSIYS